MLLKSPCYHSGSLFNLRISRRVDLGDMNYYIQKINCYVIQIIFISLHLIFFAIVDEVSAVAKVFAKGGICVYLISYFDYKLEVF